MFQLDEKAIADNRTLISIQADKSMINTITKNGTIHYCTNDSNLWLTNPKVRQAYINQDPNVLERLDRIIMARNGTNIDGSFIFDNDQVFGKNVEIKSDLLVRGNFTVEGKSSVIDTPTLTVEDNVIELNRNEKSAGITLKKAGVALNRGTAEFARYLYNETTKAFTLDTATSIDADVTDKWVIMAHTESNGSNIAGEVRVKSKLTVPTGNITDNLTVAKNTRTETLNVTSTSSLVGAATFGNTVSIADILTVSGRTLLNNSLNVKGAANFEADVNVRQNLTVDKIGTFKERAIFQKGLNITSLGADITGPVNITGNTTITGTLSTSENVSFSKDLTVGATTNTNNLNITLTTNTKDLNVSNNATITKNLVVNGTTALNSDTTITATKTTVNSLVEITGDTTITNKNLTTTSTSTSTGNVTVGGSLSVAKAMTVAGDTTLNGSVNNTGDLIANNITARNNFMVNAGNGKGIKFNAEDTYKIYVSDQADTTWGRAIASTSNGAKNMYFIMPTNKTGFVFKSNGAAVAEINALGNIHSIEHMFAKGSQVLRHADMGHAPANNTAINACMVDGKQATDLVLRDGSQAMTGDLQMNGLRIKFANDDFISFSDANDLSIGSQTYGGKFTFSADSATASSIIEAGAFSAGAIGVSGKDNNIVGVSALYGTFGTIFKSNDEWLRVNDDNTHTNGIYFGSSTLRTDGSLQIGNSGNTLIVNDTTFKYKSFDVLTTNGHNSIVGTLNSNSDIKTSASLIVAGSGSIGRLVGSGADIFLQAGISSSSTAGNLRITGYNNQNLNSIDIKVQNPNNATINGIRILNNSDQGSGNNLDADKLDGKHYSDLVNQFVDVSGDTMTGILTMGANINLSNSNAQITGNGGKNILKDHYNGNVTLAATGGDLYIGYGSDSKSVRLESSMTWKGTKTIVDANGTVPYKSISGIPKFVTNIGDGSATTITVAHGLETSDLAVTVKENSSNEIVYPDIVCTSTNIVLSFAIAPTANQYRIIAMG